MDTIYLIIITAIIALIIFSVATILTIRKVKNKKYKKTVEELDIEKNMIVGVPILSELAKVKDLVKTDNLKNKLEEWNSTFKLIKDDRISKVTDMIFEADNLIDKKEYRGAIKKIANIEMEITDLKIKSSVLLKEIKIITNSEERNRSIITRLKIQYRELQNKFDRTRKDYGEIEEALNKQFEIIEKRFQDFEKLMDTNDYVAVEKIVLGLEELIKETKILLDELPSLVLMCNILIPKRIEDATTTYNRMTRDGYPMHYLSVEYNLNEIKKKTDDIFEDLKKLRIGDASVELKTMLDYFNGLYADFDKEKISKNLFNENIKAFKLRMEKLNRVVYDIYLSLDDIKLTYDLKEDEIYKFDEINANLEKMNEDFKELVLQGKGKTFAYSNLVSELDGLNNKLKKLQEDLDYQLRSITSMKDDEYRAREQLDTIQKLLKQSKAKLKDYKLPVIPNAYFVELKETGDAIREIIKELDKKPIVIKVLNIRVDTARDLVFKVYNRTNEMIKTAMMSERLIIYGNRYRSSNSEIDKSLDKAEMLFNKGMYSQSLEVSSKAIEQVEKGITDDINRTILKELQ